MEQNAFYRVQDWALRGQHLKGKQENILWSKKLIKIVYLFSGAIYNILKNFIERQNK